jgi:hypothetical protein
MLRENCKPGMKVTTTGKTARGGKRSASACCKGQEKVGFVTLRNKFEDKIEVTHEGYVTEFYFDQIHPYWGDK